MKKIKYSLILGVLAASCAFNSCTKDLDRVPFYDVTSATVYKDAANYKQILAKMYAGLAVSGQQGPAGKPDISGIDEGFSTYLRQFWKAQELPTDEAVIGWNDGSLPDYHLMKWTAGNEFIGAMYNRIFYQISLCNEFIRETTDEKLASRGITLSNDIKNYRAEARFLRALSYWHALDMFGAVPFVTDKNPIGSYIPLQASKAELFSFIETELKALDTELADAKKNEYGRADKAAAWMVLAKLYLNAEVYTGQNKYTDCITYCNKIIGAGYTLDAEYRTLFLADNNKSNEIIFPIAFDGVKTKTWGGMTFLVHAPIGGKMDPSVFGVNGGWGGLRTTKQFVDLFADKTGATDKRAMFFTTDQNLEIEDLFKFGDGYAITKYKNVTSTGAKGSDSEGNFPDTDFPMFRLADVYLMYAEAVVRGGAGGTQAQALTYVNQLRSRAYKGAASNGNVTSIDLNFILAERGRELQWEAHRRTDLIRFKKLTTADYLWAWKGGVKEGRAVSDNLNVFPIPSSDIIANPNLKQNTGY